MGFLTAYRRLKPVGGNLGLISDFSSFNSRLSVKLLRLSVKLLRTAFIGGLIMLSRISVKRELQIRLPFLVGAYRPTKYQFIDFVVIDGKSFSLKSDFFLEKKIGKAMRIAGSDKTTVHDYQRPYAAVLNQLPEKRGPILEIGLGTNNLDVPSNMGSGGIPGASLRAWRSLDLFTEVWGADIDKRVLFSEPGIVTRYVDQLDHSTLDDLANESRKIYPEGFSLIIDDGLHIAEANNNVISALWDSVMEGGFMVIEDLWPEHLHSVVSNVINNLPEADWAIWSNVNKGPDNSMLVLRKNK
jgi:hypothetical protein